MLRDVELFQARIGKLEGASELGDYLVTIVRGKPIAAEQKAAAPGAAAELEQEQAANSSETMPQNEAGKAARG